MDQVINLCKANLRGSSYGLIDFLNDYGYLVERITKNGILFKTGAHYIFSTNGECPGCEDCKPTPS